MNVFFLKSIKEEAILEDRNELQESISEAMSLIEGEEGHDQPVKKLAEKTEQNTC